MAWDELFIFTTKICDCLKTVVLSHETAVIKYDDT